MESNIQVIEYDINSEAANLLLSELSDKLNIITGNSGEASFNKNDVLDERSVFVIAEADDKPVGCGAIRKIDNYTAEVKRMCARKSGSGTGTCILNFLEKKAKEFGYSTLICETRKINTDAVGFYIKNGYHVIENYGKYVGRDEAICFEKQINV